MKRSSSLLYVALLALVLGTHTSEVLARKDRNADVTAFLNALKADNSVYMVTHKIEFFAGLSKGQTPKATLITCADSRVQANMFDRAPEGDLFTIRNIGNQLITAEGSVEYGVHHLHTPILMIMGHSRCGAIAAVGGNYSKESPAIKKELDTIGIPKDLDNLEGVKANVHNQVDMAMIKFSEEVEDGHLTVIGAVMDFADDLHQGAGKFHIININGETDPAKLENVAALPGKRKVKPAVEPAANKGEGHPQPAIAAPAQKSTSGHAPAHH